MLRAGQCTSCVALVLALAGCDLPPTGERPAAHRQAIEQYAYFSGGAGVHLGAAIAACPGGELLVGAPGVGFVLRLRRGAPVLHQRPRPTGVPRYGGVVACDAALRAVGAPGSSPDAGSLVFLATTAGGPEVAIPIEGVISAVAIIQTSLPASSRAIVASERSYSIDGGAEFAHLSLRIRFYSADGGADRQLERQTLIEDTGVRLLPSLAAPDLDDDGRPDLIVGALGVLYLFTGQPDGGFEQTPRDQPWYWLPGPSDGGVDAGLSYRARPVVVTSGHLLAGRSRAQVAAGGPDFPAVDLLELLPDGGAHRHQRLTLPPGARIAALAAGGLLEGDASGLLVGLPDQAQVLRFAYDTDAGGLIERAPVTSPFCSAPSDEFGAALAIGSSNPDASVDLLVIGAPGCSNGPPGAGAVFVFGDASWGDPDAGSESGLAFVTSPPEARCGEPWTYLPRVDPPGATVSLDGQAPRGVSFDEHTRELHWAPRPPNRVLSLVLVATTDAGSARQTVVLNPNCATGFRFGTVACSTSNRGSAPANTLETLAAAGAFVLASTWRRRRAGARSAET
jgi:hypothetical protein